VLLEAARGGEGLAALATSVRTGANVLRADVALQVGRIGEDLLATLADVPPAFVVRDLVSNQVGLPVEDLGTLIALVLFAVLCILLIMLILCIMRIL